MKIVVKKRKCNYDKALIPMLCLLYFGLLQQIYSRLIQPIYSYTGFVKDFDLRRCAVAWLCFCVAIPFIYISHKRKKISATIITVLLLCNYAPGLILYIYRQTDFFWYFVLYYLMLMTLGFSVPCIKTKRITNIRMSDYVDVIGVLIGAVVIYIWGRYAGFRLQNSLLNVYDQRAEAATYDMPTLMSYIFSMSKSVIPFFIVYSLYKRKTALTIYYAISQYIGFCVDASKSAIFMVLFSVGAYFLLKKFPSFIKALLILLSLGVLASFAEKAFTGTFYISGVLYRRILFVPTQLNYDYYSFFSINEFDFFRNSIRLFGESPYIGSDIPKIIGLYNGSGSSANNGLFSDAYLNLGFMGMIVMPILLVIIFKLMESYSDGLPNEVSASMIIISAITFLSSSFFTCLLSHGIALLILISMICDKNKDVPLLSNTDICEGEV